MIRQSLVLLTILSMGVALLPTSVIFAQNDDRGFELTEGFDPNFLLTDDDMFDAMSMSRDRIISFLTSKGTLGDHIETDIDGQQKLVADIIIRVSQSYKISPRFLLVLMQREQSLVEDPNPSQNQFDWAMGFGVCDACSKDDPSISDFKGFANQVEYASRQIREKYYMRYLSLGHLRSAYVPGENVLIDGVSVTPINFATAALYTYTPHIHGNQNLWHIWRKWFSKNYPNGTVVRAEPSGTIYWLKFGEKRPFASQTVAATLIDMEKIISVSESDLSGYDDGSPIQFPNYALLRDEHGKIWLIVDDDRRHIVNLETFHKFGFNMDEVEDVLTQDLASYAIGSKITLDEMYPRGQLVQAPNERAVWYAEGGKRYVLTHAAIWTLYFNNRHPQEVPSETLQALEDAGPYLLHDGELVKAESEPTVYVIEQGLKRMIPSEDIFLELAYDWSDIEVLPDAVLADYHDGAAILINHDNPELALAL